jgi:hypothetical protein
MGIAIEVSNGMTVEADDDFNVDSGEITVWVLEVETFNPEASPPFSTITEYGIFETDAEAQANAPEDAKLYAAEVAE